MYTRHLSLLFTLFLLHTSYAQIIRLEPSVPTADEMVTLYFDASKGGGELRGESTIYIHHGIVTSGINGTDWQNVIGNWGQDDGIGKMTKVAGEEDLWKIDFTPTIRSYFQANDNETIYRISAVFRSADGETKGTIAQGKYPWGEVASNLDMYIDIDAGEYITLDSPGRPSAFYTEGETLPITVSTSSTADSIVLQIESPTNGVQTMVNYGTNSITLPYTIDQNEELSIIAIAQVRGNNLRSEFTHQIYVKSPPVYASLPTGAMAGINYHEDDDTKVTLVLEAPRKEFAYVVGDMNDWQIDSRYQMNQTLDRRYLWLTLDNIDPEKEYVYQYWVDGEIKIADPYTTKIADPYHDAFIPASVHPEIPVYDKSEYGIASTFKTGRDTYTWSPSEDRYNRPDIDHLVIYELHIRDFLASHSFQDLQDTLTYLKRLGINAIELMPINEFEGNDSWGYNPSFFFAVDKYYGTENALKSFIEAAHQEGIAVILDIVLNHSFSQSPLLQLYFDRENFIPTEDNPWYNQDYVGPYEWGFDFDHESIYTQRFIDRVNAYWLEEFHFDGFRFDFTKGFTNNEPGGSLDPYDRDRIRLLRRMQTEIEKVDPDAYIILEHWGTSQEERELAASGMKMWRNKSYDFVPATVGRSTGNFFGMEDESHVSFFGSHDEQRLAYHVLKEGLSSQGYDTRQPEIAFERIKLAMAFKLLPPGPKMLWQFDEIGYDIDIDFNGRTGRKPLPWGSNSLGYDQEVGRLRIYETTSALLQLRHQLDPAILAEAQTNHKLTGDVRRLVYDTQDDDMVLVGNFGLKEANIDPAFPSEGFWYNYLSGDSIEVTNTNQSLTLAAGEWIIYTNRKLSDGFEDLVSTYENPVTINPSSFQPNQRITITYDASKGSSIGQNPNGLIGANKVYMHSGVVLEGSTDDQLTNIVGTLEDDGVGEMTYIGNDKWEISITPNSYYPVGSNEIRKIGMYFRDANNTTQGYGFRESIIYFDVQSAEPILSITPASFDLDTEITITYDASQGNAELINSDAIYLHSSMGLIESPTPHNNAWNNVVGNWGQNDGIGEMTKIRGTNKWTISLTPRDYYGLSDGDFPYWLAAVFRSPDGNTKGTATPGPIPFGYIHSNLDFFIQNQKPVTTQNEIETLDIWPNPANEYVNFSFNNGDALIYNMQGKLITSAKIVNGMLDVSTLVEGWYHILVTKQDGILASGNIIIKR